MKEPHDWMRRRLGGGCSKRLLVTDFLFCQIKTSFYIFRLSGVEQTR